MERLSSRGVLESANGLQIDRASRGAVGIVLAGGKSRRLGQDKALLRVDGNIPLVVLAAERLREVVGEAIVVGDDCGRLSSLPFRVVSDRYPGAGPLGGIYSGLLAVEPARALVVACDMPFLNPRLLSYMLSLPGDYDVLLPRRASGYLEPLHAVYTQTCREVLRRQLDAARYSAIGYLDQVSVRYVDEAEMREFDPELESFFNVNTPADLARAVELGGMRGPRQTLLPRGTSECSRPVSGSASLPASSPC